MVAEQLLKSWAAAGVATLSETASPSARYFWIEYMAAKC
jgi:hypothetical protein